VPTECSTQGEARRAAALGLLLVALLSSIYLLSYTGTFRADDEHILAARAQSLALTGELAEPQVYGNLRVRELSLLGDTATQIEPLQSVLGAGLVRLAVVLGVGGVQAGFLLNLYVTAFTAGVVFLLVLSLGHEAKVAFWCGLIFGLGSMAWPFATTFFRDSLAMMMVAIAFLGWSWVLRDRWSARIAGSALMAVGLAAGLLAKNTVAAWVPAFAAVWIVMGFRNLRSGRGKAWGLVAVLALGSAILVTYALIPPTGPLARYSLDYIHFLARHSLEGLRLSLIPAILGPFLSPAKSVFLFSPPLVLGVIGAARTWSKAWRFVLPAVLGALFLATAQALFYRDRWAGAYGWGLRYMLPVLPLLAALAAPAIDALSLPGRRSGRALWWFLLGLGGLIQMGGGWVSWQPLYADWRTRGLDPSAASAAWDPTFLAIPPQMALLVQPASWQVAWARLLRAGNIEAIWVPVVSLLIAGMALLLIRRLWRTGEVGAGIRIPLALCLTSALAALAAPVFPTLWVYREDPDFGGNRIEFAAALARLETAAGPEDTIVVDAYGTSLWRFMMNRWTGPLRWYSLPFEIPGSPGVDTAPGGMPSEPAIDLFELAASRPGVLWYLTSADAPDYGLGREVAWLDAEFTLEAAETFPGSQVVELREYDPRGRSE